MMNCVSSDFKEMAFYKFFKKTNSNESKLLSRPMKTKWQDFVQVVLTIKFHVLLKK